MPCGRNGNETGLILSGLLDFPGRFGQTAFITGRKQQGIWARFFNTLIIKDVWEARELPAATPILEGKAYYIHIQKEEETHNHSIFLFYSQKKLSGGMKKHMK